MFGRKTRGTRDDQALAALVADARRWDSGPRHARRAEQPGTGLRETLPARWKRPADC